MGKTIDPGSARSPSSSSRQREHGLGVSSTEELILPPRSLFKPRGELTEYFSGNLVAHINALNKVLETDEVSFPKLKAIYSLADSISRFSHSLESSTVPLPSSACIDTSPGSESLRSWKRFSDALALSLDHTCKALSDLELRKEQFLNPDISKKLAIQIDAATGLLLIIQLTSNDLTKKGQVNTRSKTVREAILSLDLGISSFIESFYSKHTKTDTNGS